MPTFDDVKRCLHLFDGQQLRELQAIIATMRRGKNEDVKQEAITSGFELGVMSEIVEAMKGYGFTSVAMLQASSAYPAFHEKVPEIDKWLEKGGAREFAMKLWFIRFAFRMMLHDRRREGWECSGVGLMSNIHRIPAVLDRAFPGYASVGILGLIRRRREEGINR